MVKSKAMLKRIFLLSQKKYKITLSHCNDCTWSRVLFVGAHVVNITKELQHNKWKQF